MIRPQSPPALTPPDDSLLSMEEIDQVIGGLARPLMEDEFARTPGPVGGVGVAHGMDPFQLPNDRAHG